MLNDEFNHFYADLCTKEVTNICVYYKKSQISNNSSSTVVMAKMPVKLERMSPSPPVSVKEESSSECPTGAAADGTVADDAEADDEICDVEAGDGAEQKPLSHQQAMEHFKDALAEIIVVCIFILM